MRDKSKVLLVVDDKEKCSELCNILDDEFLVAAERDAKSGIKAIGSSEEKIALIIVDLAGTPNGNNDFITMCMDCRTLHKIPIIVSFDMNASDEEVNSAINCGAWDFIRRPYNGELIRFRVNNIITANEISVYREIKYRENYDTMTGLYNRTKFFEETRKVIDNNPDMTFAFIRFDIYKFQLVNQFYGVAEGDKLIKFIANDMGQDVAEAQSEYGSDGKRVACYGHIEVDVFCCCVPFESREKLLMYFKNMRLRLENYGLNFVILPVFGVYIVEDRSLTINEMYDRANLASKKCKGNYIENYAFYDDEMGRSIIDEQMIVNEMSMALEQEQFALYLQPKYEIKHNTLVGAEVLVRWLHPEKGMISPGMFIPIFERNGFIRQLDNYVWEHTCILLRRWLDEGKKPDPVSVNMSRISLYNPKLVDIICGLVEKYDVPPALMQLELTESAFMDNPVVIRETMRSLQEHGFTVLMDDFGSGYSSLNALKDMSLDIIKMDMRFLSKTEYPERSKCIMASVVRMAKWLKMSVTAEGVETKDQLDFLKSIGCEYIQGFYFAKPMSVEDYEKCAFQQLPHHNDKIMGKKVSDSNTIYAYNDQMNALFSNMFQPVALYEYCEGNIEVIRVNSAYYETFGYNDVNVTLTDGWFNNTVAEEFRDTIVSAFERTIETKDSAGCEYLRCFDDGTAKWVHVDLKYVGNVEDRHIIFAILMDVTVQKKIYGELLEYRRLVFPESKNDKFILIVEDEEINRAVLNEMFAGKYTIYEAADGKEALNIMRDRKIDLILLDIRMPVMNGMEFMKHKQSDERYKDIPVIIMSSDKESEIQREFMEMGCSDYIVKPFVPEVVMARVANVFTSSKADAVSRDKLTGLYDKNTAGGIIQTMLENENQSRALLLIDIDNFEQINREYGRIAGDKAIKSFANELSKYFRKCDIVARYEGDEFVVFVGNIPTKAEVVRRCENLINTLDVIIENGVKLECSIGISYSNVQTTFSEMMEKADRALYIAKNRGKNQCILYDE